MKTRNLAFMLFTLLVLAVVVISSEKNIFNSGCEQSYLMLQNIEALSNDEEDGYDSTTCSDGAPFYALAQSYSGKIEVVEHLYDGYNGYYGIDNSYFIYYEGCYASGNGNVSGGTYVSETRRSPEEIKPCTGSSGHKKNPFQ